MTKKINNTIKESYCSFELSKLLKDKGFDCFHNKSYMDFGVDGIPDMKIVNWVSKQNTPAPTHALAIEWIRVNFEIFLQPLPVIKGYVFAIYDLSNPLKLIEGEMKKSFKSPQEATEAALLYALKNLIK